MAEDVDHLVVLVEGREVAELTRTSTGATRLTYQSSARTPGSTPLSLALPASRASHIGEPVDTFLRGLIPESDRALSAIARRYRIDTSSVMNVLAVIGLDCAGAIQFCRTEDLPALTRRDGSLEPCTDSEIEARLGELELDEGASWTMPGEHWSLGVTQQKFALRRQDGRWYMAHGAEPTTHIVKPGIRQLVAQALAEHVSMEVAHRLGLDVARTSFESFKSADALVVERFDRELTADGVRRRHQEDLCQALGVQEKYQEFGGPSALEVIRLLRDAADTAAQARRNVSRFIDGLIYNTVIGAPDAHARNWAVLLEGDSVALAPMYDVATGFGYTVTQGRGRWTSMSVGGSFELDRIDLDAWRRFAGQARVDEGVVLDRVREFSERAPDEFALVLAEFDRDPSAAELSRRIASEFAARA